MLTLANMQYNSTLMWKKVWKSSKSEAGAFWKLFKLLSSPEPKAQGELLWLVVSLSVVPPLTFSLNDISSWTTGPNFI